MPAYIMNSPEDGGFILVITGINPEPWEVGNAYVVRGGGRSFAKVGPSARLSEYQEALRHEASVAATESGSVASILESKPDLEVSFIFRRKLEEGVSKAGRRRYGKPVDVTNLQKGAEDALQGVLYDNDRSNLHVSAVIEQQSREVDEPIIVVRVTPLSLEDKTFFTEHLDDLAKSASGFFELKKEKENGNVSSNDW